MDRGWMLVAGATVFLAVWFAFPAGRLPARRHGVDVRPLRWLQPRPDAPGRRTRCLAGAAVAVALFLFLGGAAGVLLGGAAGLATTVALGRFQTGSGRRGRRELVLELPETLDLLAAALEAGLPLRLAVVEVAELGPPATRAALQGVAARVAVGMSDGEAWRALAQDEDWRLVAGDLARSSETGSAAAQVLRQHAADARSRRHDELLKRARAVGVRSTLPLMTCFLPAFMLVGVVPVVAGLVGQLFPR